LGWRIPLDRLRKLTVTFLLLVIVLLAFTLVPGISLKAGGASRWLRIGGISFQPAELAKLATILFVAFQVQRKIRDQSNWARGFLTYFVPMLPVYALLLLQPDFGTTAICLCSTLVILLGSGLKLKYLLTSLALMAPVGAVLIATSSYRMKRLMTFLDPWADPAANGFQVIQSLLAFYSGKWFGVGLGNSREKLFYLPEAHNDFIFAVVGEELGLFGVLLFVSLYLVIVLRGLTVAERCQEPFRKAVAFGVCAVIGLQAFFNMGVVLGLLPTKGLPLPLISYGGTALVVNLFLLGLLTQISEALE
jgi:cell division protein FtsW